MTLINKTFSESQLKTKNNVNKARVELSVKHEKKRSFLTIFVKLFGPQNRFFYTIRLNFLSTSSKMCVLYKWDQIDPIMILILELFCLYFFKTFRRRHRLKGIHSRSDTNRTEAEGLSFYYPRLLHCLNQVLAVVLLSQHRVSSFKTVRPRAPCGARCIGHAISTWSAVCSEAPHSQFGEGARPHLCMDEWNCPTSVRRRLSLTIKLLFT